MRDSRVVGWLLFTVWAVWLFALQGLFAGGGSAGPWAPDLGLVLALAVAARAHPGDVPWLVALASLARATFGVEPLLAVLAGFALVLAPAQALRSVVETTGPLPRMLLAGASVLVFDAWLIAVQHVRAGGGARSADLAAALDQASSGQLLGIVPAALASALAALLAGPAFARLPGLTPLRRRRW